jgi:hypothetical protein
VKSDDTKYVKFTLDPANPPRLTEEEKARYHATTDADIVYDEDSPDTSDWPDDMWTRPGLADRKAPASPNGNRNGTAVAKKDNVRRVS